MLVNVANGGFEIGNATDSYADSGCIIPGWITTPSSVADETTCPLYIKTGRPIDAEYGGTNAADGTYFLALRRYGSSIAQQVKKHEVDVTYRLNFYIASRNFVTQTPSVGVKIAGIDYGAFIATSRTMTVQHIDYNVTAAEISIEFENRSPDQYGTIYIDYIHIGFPPAGSEESHL